VAISTASPTGIGPTIKPRSQRFTLDELGHDERTAVVIAEVMQDQDVGVIERRGSPRFSVEATQSLGIPCHTAREPLQRDGPIQPGIVRAVDLAHASGPDEGVYPVTAHDMADEIVGPTRI
jgi:hypothetical protein